MITELKGFAFNNYNEIENLAIQNRDITSNVLDFLNTRHFLIDEHDTNKLFFIKKWSLPVGKKIIILSATANEFVYRKLYGNRIEFYDLGNVELKGKLIQDTTLTFSKQNLIKAETLQYASEKIEERMVITFQKCARHFKTAYKNIYFGNCQGKDKFKDKPLAIIGTPHVNPATYFLYSKFLGLSYKPEDFRMNMYSVHRNGMYFNFFTFENEDLRNLQFYFIERELRQAVGRARLIREPNADVLVFSNFPLPEAKQLNEI